MKLDTAQNKNQSIKCETFAIVNMQDTRQDRTHE
jgi:hypothetical protein